MKKIVLILFFTAVFFVGSRSGYSFSSSYNFVEIATANSLNADYLTIPVLNNQGHLFFTSQSRTQGNFVYRAGQGFVDKIYQDNPSADVYLSSPVYSTNDDDYAVFLTSRPSSITEQGRDLIYQLTKSNGVDSSVVAEFGPPRQLESPFYELFDGNKRQEPTLNNSGDVAFYAWAQDSSLLLERSLFVAKGGEVDVDDYLKVISESSAYNITDVAEFRLTDDGYILVKVHTSDHQNLILRGDGTETSLSDFEVVLVGDQDPSNIVQEFDNAIVFSPDGEHIAFKGYSNPNAPGTSDLRSIYQWDTGEDLRVLVPGNYFIDDLQLDPALSINANGDVLIAKNGSLKLVKLGATEPIDLFESDIFNGKDVFSLGIDREALNDKGQIAFHILYADQSTGVYLGTPKNTNSASPAVPEPATIFLLGSGLLGFALKRKKAA